MSKKRGVRRVTTPVRTHLNDLADILYEFLPLSSPSKNTVTFGTIFAESRIEPYLRGPTNKRQALQQGLAELYRRHERLPWTIIRKIVPAAVEYRRHQGRPLKRSELQALANCLKTLGIDMVKELESVELDETLPRTTVPPEELKQRLRGHDLEPSLTAEPLDLFEAGHFNESVRKAAEKFEDRVHELSGLSAHGRNLMAKAFANGALLDVESYEPENRDGFVNGYRFLAMGAMASIRNVFSHGDEERRSPEQCFEMLLFLNWLFRGLKSQSEHT
ncbi:MAG: TIGR02391 family protein [Firmicutes bacterium]|jgi:uncharacterized protein (TIGR02391 family)|nr:TIGR02391 family protein [Bacillota bacterium]MDD4335957.1 TIGR02391 family protein [Bacillota bacterium]MDD4792195.1 TIGR02391 family protein [Bacillota bacterium]